MAKIKVDVDGIERTLNEIERDLHRGMEKSVDTLVNNAKGRARKVISENNAIFNTEVYAGFRDAETRNTSTNVRAKLYNNVEHADVLEEGAQFPAQGPPVEALLPWVVRKMDWRPDGGLDWGDDDGGRPDSFGGDDDDGAGGNDNDHSTEDTTVVDEDTVEEDTTDEGLTLSKQADDLSIEGGDLYEGDERASRQTLFQVEKYQRDYDMPKVDSVGYGDYDTLEDAFDDTSATISLPHTQIEWDTEFSGANIDDILEQNTASDWYYNTSYENHLGYVIDHQYGRYLYENLSDDGLNEFRRRWGFTETDSGWELPDDADDISGLATQGEAEFFAEVFVERGVYNYRQSQKEEYFENIEALDADYFNDSFLDKPRDTVDYSVGYDYSGDREVVLESHLDDVETYDDISFTTDFDNQLYLEEDAYHEWSTYVFTSPSFEGAKALRYDNGQFNDRQVGDLNYDIEELTLHAIPEGERIFNQLDDDDEIIIEAYDGLDWDGDYVPVKFRYLDDRPWEGEVAEGTNPFTGDPVEIHRQDIVGYREDHPDLWSDGVETVQPVSESDIDDDLVTPDSESEIDGRIIYRSIQNTGNIVIEDDSGDLYRVETSGYDEDGEFISLYPNEEGEHLHWDYDYDNLDDNEISISHVHEHAIKYDNIEIGDDIMVDPDALEHEPAFTDSTYRATVEYMEGDTPLVVPFGQSTNANDRVNYEGFIEPREDIPGWDSKNWDKGRKVTVDTHRGEVTGRIDIPDRDSLSYEAGRIRMQTEDGRTTYFGPMDVVSSEDDDFMEERIEPRDNLDLSITNYQEYDGEVTTDMLRPSDYDPMEDADELGKGDYIVFRNDRGHRREGEIQLATTDDNDNVQYILYEGGGRPNPDDIIRYDGQGTDAEKLSEGDVVSTGSGFSTVVDRHEDPESGEITGVYVDMSGDGETDDLLNESEVVPVDVQFPEGTNLYFWSYREGEWKTGEVRRTSGNNIYIEGSDGTDYETYSTALYPAKIFGYNI